MKKQIVFFLGWVVLGAIPPAVFGQMPPESDEAVKTKEPAAEQGVKENGEQPGKQEEKKLILPEGYQIADLSAKLVNSPQDNRWFLVFDRSLGQEAQKLAQKEDKKSKSLSANTALDTQPPVNRDEMEKFVQPIEVLPGQKLAEMKEVCHDSTDMTITFRIWGEITTYQKRNFILPNNIYQKSMFGDGGKNEKSKEKISVLEARLLPEQDTKNFKESETEAEVEAEESKGEVSIPANLRESLQAIPRTHPLNISAEEEPAKPTETSKQEGFAIGGYSPAIWRDGYMVVDRLGRIVLDMEQRCWVFTFETDGDSMAEPPVIIHPSRLLEVMENVVERSGRSSLFQVTGQVTKYQGKNYLLLRKVLLVHDMGNLGK